MMQLPHGPSLLTHPDTVNHCRAAVLIADNDLPPPLVLSALSSAIVVPFDPQTQSGFYKGRSNETETSPLGTPSRVWLLSLCDENREFVPHLHPTHFPQKLLCVWSECRCCCCWGSSPAPLKHFKRLCLHSRVEKFDLTRLPAPPCTFDTLPAGYKWSVGIGHCGDNERELNAGRSRQLSLNQLDGFWVCRVAVEKEPCAHFKRHTDPLL